MSAARDDNGKRPSGLLLHSVRVDPAHDAERLKRLQFLSGGPVAIWIEVVDGGRTMAIGDTAVHPSRTRGRIEAVIAWPGDERLVVVTMIRCVQSCEYRPGRDADPRKRPWDVGYRPRR